MDGLFATLLHSNLLIFVFLIVFVSTSNGTVADAPSRLVLKLIHPSKIVTPYYDSNVQRAIDSSMARYAYLKTKDIQTSKMDVIQPRLTANFSGFYVNLAIGEPPVSQMLLLDSGNYLTWIQCLPCIHCLSQPNPYYDPSKSSTYRRVLNNSPDCKLVTGSSSSPSSSNDDACHYELKYAGGFSSSGEVGKEKFTFSTSDDGKISIPDVVFGCGNENYGPKVNDGILGLDASNVSLVSKLGSKFSYCLGNLSDSNYEYNQLVIGEGAVFEGDTTPLVINRGFYFLTLEGITFGETKLDVDPSIFKLSPEGKGGVVIDSGTFYNFLARSAYNALTAQVESWVNGRLAKVAERSGGLCYKGIMSRDLDVFPVVRFQFAGALIEVDYEGIFYQETTDVFCLAATPVDDYQLNVIGIRFQQYFNVGYDITKKTLYFQRIDCRLLETF